MLNLRVDEFLVGDVDQRSKKDDRSCEKSEAPGGKELDEVVAGQGSHESL